MYSITKVSRSNFFSVANGHYKTSGEEEYVIVGNDALLKCKIPSFVSDFVSVISWQQVETGSVFYLNIDGQKQHGMRVLR